MNERELLPAGKYKFQIDFADCDYISSKGNKAIKLKLLIMHQGEKHVVWEYLTKKPDPATNKPYAFIVRKTNDLLASMGKSNLKGAHLTNDDLLGGFGWAVIRIENSEEYGESNKVARFITEDRNREATPKTVEEPEDESIEDLLARSVPVSQSITPTAAPSYDAEVPPFSDDDIPF